MIGIKQCWICECAITKENDSREHVIPGAIGGRKVVTGFICRACNSRTGTAWDAVLSEQLHGIGLLFNISRQRGSVPSMRVTTAMCEPLIFQPGNRLLIPPGQENVRNPDGSISIRMNDITVERIRKRLDGLKERYQKRFPKGRFTREDITHENIWIESPIDLKLEIGGADFDKSLVKSALALACSIDIGIDDAMMAVNYLRDNRAGQDGRVCQVCYTHDLVRDRPGGLPLHCVFVVGDPNTRTLLAYVEVYGMVRRIICLSDRYEGGSKAVSYAINPITGEDVPGITFGLDHSVFLEVIETQTRTKALEGFRKAVNEVLRYQQTLRFEREFREHFEDSLDACISLLGLSVEDELTVEQRRLLAGCITEKMREFFEHWIRPLDPLVRP